MATTVPFFTQQAFTVAGSPHSYATQLPQGITQVNALLDVKGTSTPSPEGGTYLAFPGPNDTFTGTLYDSPDGVSGWRQRSSSSFYGGGGTSQIIASGLRPFIRYDVTVTGVGPITASVSGTLS